MPTSDASWSGRLRLIGDLERPDHHHLEAGDQCAFFGEYTPGEGWKHSSTNNLILNLKKGTEDYPKYGTMAAQARCNQRCRRGDPGKPRSAARGDDFARADPVFEDGRAS